MSSRIVIGNTEHRKIKTHATDRGETMRDWLEELARFLRRPGDNPVVSRQEVAMILDHLGLRGLRGPEEIEEGGS